MKTNSNEINPLYLEINKKLYNKGKIDNGNFYPVINTFYFLHVFTKSTKDSFDLYNKFTLFYDNLDSTKLKTEAVLDFIQDITNSSVAEIEKTEMTSNSLTENICYIPFELNGKSFIATWLSNKFLINQEQIVFLELQKNIPYFIEATHKIWYISKKTRGKQIFIDYAKDINCSNMVIQTKNGFYEKGTKTKITFVF
jgi:ribosomal protein S8